MEEHIVRRRHSSSTAQPLTTVHHDVLVVSQPSTLYRAECDKQSGAFTSGLKEVGPGEEGHRKVLNIVQGAASRVGFALLPVRPEPASSFFCCYLVNEPAFASSAGVAPVPTVTLCSQTGTQSLSVQGGGTGPQAPEAPRWKIALARSSATGTPSYSVDARQLDFVNPWTEADWSGLKAKKKRVWMRSNDPNTSRVVLLTGATRQVFRVADESVSGSRKADDNWILPEGFLEVIDKGAVLGTVENTPFVNLSLLPSATSILFALPGGLIRELHPRSGACTEFSQEQIRKNPEVWRLLRNGCVVGEAKITRGDATNAETALVINLCSLVSDEETDDDSAQADKAIVGTLDFKWQPGTVLRVAFQKSSDSSADMASARTKFEECARSWQSAANISFDFIEAWFPVREQAHPLPLVDYDILVNFDNLPVDLKETVSDPSRNVALPVSDIGSYGLRRTYGTPTMFLGWHPQLKMVPHKKDYFTSDAFIHISLHEIGHALGLPHLHQSPQIPDPFAPNLIQTLHLALGVMVTSDFVAEELQRRWEPAGIPNPFSEWPDDVSIPQESEQAQIKRLVAGSVMMGLPVKSVFKNWQGNAVSFSQALGTIDKAWAAKLYGARNATPGP